LWIETLSLLTSYAHSHPQQSMSYGVDAGCLYLQGFGMYCRQLSIELSELGRCCLFHDLHLLCECSAGLFRILGSVVQHACSGAVHLFAFLCVVWLCLLRLLRCIVVIFQYCDASRVRLCSFSALFSIVFVIGSSFLSLPVLYLQFTLFLFVVFDRILLISRSQFVLSSELCLRFVPVWHIILVAVVVGGWGVVVRGTRAAGGWHGLYERFVFSAHHDSW